MASPSIGFMRVTFLDTDEDCQWLRDTHLKGLNPPPFKSATILGNEDSPERIVLYPIAEPTIYTTRVATYNITHDGFYCLVNIPESGSV